MTLSDVDERVRQTVEWLSEAVDPGDALVRVRRKKVRQRLMRRAQTAALIVATLAASAGGLLGLARVFGVGEQPRSGSIPDVGTIAFVSDRDGDAEIYVRWSDGTLRSLTDNDIDDLAPAWSHDGTMIAFLRQEGRDFSVWIMRADGTEARRVTEPGGGGPTVVAGEVSADTMWFSSLSWSPDGSRIAFGGREVGLARSSERCSSLDRDVFSVGVDGSDLVNLTNTDGSDESDPAWAPQDDAIIFARCDRLADNAHGPLPPTIPQIYLLTFGEQEAQQLTRLPGSATAPAWSPDGTRIAFEGDGDIYVMNADGSGLRRLVVLPPPTANNTAPHPTYGNYEPSWTANGKSVMFTSDRDGDRDLYVMPAEGTEDQAVRVTDLDGNESLPALRPGRDPNGTPPGA